MSDPAKCDGRQFGSLIREWGICIDPDQALKLDIFLDELELWNRKINLTGLTSRQRIVDELLFDSLLPASFLPEQGTLLDVGSGAGFPAIPLKICKPGLRCQLIEPNSKKVHFIRQVVRLAQLTKIEVVEGRMEEQKGYLMSEGYDVITSRAFLPLPGFLTLCAPHLSPDGCMIAFLGGQSESSRQESARIFARHSLLAFKRIPYAVPGKNVRREILILKRTPRREAMTSTASG